LLLREIGKLLVYGEAKLAKENGAVGIFLRGSERDLLLRDSYFFPRYDAASRLDLPICIHSATGSSVLFNYWPKQRKKE